MYRLLSKLYFIFAIDIESYCDFLAPSSAIDVDRLLTSCTCCFGPVGAPPSNDFVRTRKAIKLVSTDVNVQATLEVTLASVRIDVAVASSPVLVVVSSVEMLIRVHRTPLRVRYFLGLLANELDPIYATSPRMNCALCLSW